MKLAQSRSSHCLNEIAAELNVSINSLYLWHKYQLTSWRKEFIASFDKKTGLAAAADGKSLKQTVKQLEADFQKNLALAASAALLVLSKNNSIKYIIL